uniref:ACT domain-containing protein n=1 Tax=Chlamydomonas leiostraca TaxID=1034604 RepID=A0A7S0RGX1_9CHLO|mmetsp:Transcript_22599/g.57466  ORF Transcript_22599/g.57466 Transcript_22599/m.57466 type:complete len:471 (+) Transcript_22599:21-1433(+)
MQLQYRAPCCGAAGKQRSVASVRLPSSVARPVPCTFAAPVHSSSSSFQRSVEARAAETTGKTSYDVYVNEPKALKEGEEKHVISVFVADEAGLINRVAGVFARRGANIESLAVGLTADKALFTIVVTGVANTVSNLVKQLSKLVKVRYVEDITKGDRIEREMLLLKLGAPPGPARTEVLQLAQIFRARVVDVSETTLTLCVSGDPGKCAAMCKVMSKFGVVELTRTGRVCLLRGIRALEPSSVGEGARRPAAPAAVAAPAAAKGEYGVYGEDDAELAGVWEVDNILDPVFEEGSDFEAHTLNIEVQDVPGVLNQVTGVFARRGYNVQSLAVGPSEREGMSRIVMVVPGSQPAIAKLVRQLEKLVFVENVEDLTAMPFVNRELMLVKVRCTSSQRGELRDLAAIFRAQVLDVSLNTMTIEILGKQDKMKALTDLLEPYGILEIARTGRVAVARESGVDSKFLEQRQSQRIY